MKPIKVELETLYKDYTTGKYMIVLSTKENIMESLSKFLKKAVSVVIGETKKKRSLNANAYAWVLMTEIANVLRVSKEEVYNSMLARYGQVDKDESGNAIFITAMECVDFSRREDIHVKYIRSREHNGETYIDYILLKGSSKYDTGEMAIFIDGIISECRDLDIETIPPDELKRMKEIWQPKES